MKRALVLACLIMAAGPATAGTWDTAYNGTIMAVYTDGRTAKVFVNADQSYSIVLPNGMTFKGIWTDADGQSCFTTTDPPPAPGTKPVCFPAKDYKVGDSFNGEDASGKFIGTIQAGR